MYFKTNALCYVYLEFMISKAGKEQPRVAHISVLDNFRASVAVITGNRHSSSMTQLCEGCALLVLVAVCVVWAVSSLASNALVKALVREMVASGSLFTK